SGGVGVPVGGLAGVGVDQVGFGEGVHVGDEQSTVGSDAVLDPGAGLRGGFVAAAGGVGDIHRADRSAGPTVGTAEIIDRFERHPLRVVEHGGHRRGGQAGGVEDGCDDLTGFREVFGGG